MAHEHHEDILDAVRRGDETGAVEAMRRHLETNVRHLTTMSHDDAVE
jgi:DNA-binding GntR family transcriptional regulator